jgi:hypothetical protein
VAVVDHPEIDLTLVVEDSSMYGEAAIGRAPRGPEQQEARVIERVSDIQRETINVLESCKRSLDHLIGKTLGPRPEPELNKQLESVSSLMSDAKQVNILAHQLESRLEEVHQSIGHDKQ